MNLRSAFFAAAIAGAGALGAGSAQAMPLAPAPGAASMIEQVAMGCGRGWTRDAFGRCVPMVVRPMVRPRYYYRPVYPAPRRYYYRRYW